MTQKQVTQQGEKALVFTYGTLRPSLYPNVPQNFHVKPLGPARLEGSRLTMYNLGHFPALIDVGGDPPAIIGEVVEAQDLRRLDRYEGYTGDKGGLYLRKVVDVIMHDGVKKQAIVYYMAGLRRHHEGCDVVQSGDWATTQPQRKPR